MPEFVVSRLLDTPTLAVRRVLCAGHCRHRSAEECSAATHLVFPYRGTYLRHVGSDQAVADANHVLFFNAGEAYQVSHPVAGGDACLVLALSQPLLRELTPADLAQKRDEFGFRVQSLRIDARAQALVALLHHSLERGSIETLEAESLLLTLVSRTLGPRTTHAAGSTPARRRLVDRVKLLLASDLSRRWTLTGIASEIGGSAVYLTQAFSRWKACRCISTSCACAWRERWTGSLLARTWRPWRWTWVFPATVISPRPSGRLTDARRANSGRRFPLELCVNS
jgi:hypothetical protein